MIEYDAGNFTLPTPLPPPGKATKDVLLDWVKQGLYYGHHLRVQDTSNMRRAELYDGCVQWLKRAAAGYDTGMSGASSWARMYWAPDDPNWIPTPVYNEGFGARQNETARIGAPKYLPTTRVTGQDRGIEIREGARKVERQLRHRLKEMHWDRRQDLAYYHQPIYGGFWIRSEWETTWERTTIVPVQGAQQCISGTCDFKSASPKIPKRLAGQIGAQAGDGVLEESKEYGGDPTLKACPQCPDHPPLIPFKPTMREARTTNDSLGRSMGQTVPLGDWNLSVRSGYDVFPRDLGIDMEPGYVDEVTEAHVETLDWGARRWPDKMGKVQPENPATLAKYHPIAGAPDVMQGVLHSSVFRNSTRCIERHRAPQMQLTTRPDGSTAWEMDKGRSVVTFGGEVMLDADLLMPSQVHPGQTVERVMYDYCPWELKDGGRRLQGISLWDLLYDPQDTRNEIASQRALVRERCAVPFYVFFKEHQMQIKSMTGGIPGRMVEISIGDPSKPVPMPQLLNNQTIDAGVNTESDDAVHSIDRYSGNTKTEQGITSSGDPAELFRQAKEASGERRENRIHRISACLKNGFSHGYKLMSHLYIEPRPSAYEEDDGEERWTTVEGKDFPTNLEIDVKPENVDEDETRQILKDMLAIPGLLDVQNDKKLARKVRQHFNAPEDLDEDMDLQEKAAQREWVAFREDGTVPVVDPGLDDHSTHYEQHGRAAHSEWFRDLEEKAQWDEALKILGEGWHQELMMISAMPAPPCRQDRIVMWWATKMDMFKKAAAMNPDAYSWAGDPEALKQVMDWRAHTEAHRLEDEAKQQAAMAGPMLAAPGAEQTPAGNQPTDMAPPEVPMPGPAPMEAAPVA